MRNHCFILLSIFVISILSCTPAKRVNTQGIVEDGKYDSEFPSQPSSTYLEEIAEAVRLVSGIAFYESYDFSIHNRVTMYDIMENLYINKSDQKSIFSAPASGSATIIHFSNNRIAVLTCAHTITFPDTIITHFLDERYNKLKYIKNLAIKKEQSFNLIGIRGGNNLNTLAIDKKHDIALLGKKLPAGETRIVPVLRYKPGKAKELSWGSFVYIFGYPSGKQMVSRALVSSPNREPKHSFMMDVTMERGISGGLVLAIRDGIPNFELVGMANALTSEVKYHLHPDKSETFSDIPVRRPYEGQVFLEPSKSVTYGATFAVSIEAIVRFIQKNHSNLKRLGYNFNHFIPDGER